jgi:hypothetical protein
MFIIALYPRGICVLLFRNLMIYSARNASAYLSLYWHFTILKNRYGLRVFLASKKTIVGKVEIPAKLSVYRVMDVFIDTLDRLGGLYFYRELNERRDSNPCAAPAHR